MNHFILFLKPVRFIIRTDLKIMPGIFRNENLMAENNSRILKWFIWLSNFDFDIVYKPGYLNCLVDMLTREQSEERKPALSMFSAGASSSNPGQPSNDRGKALVEKPKDGLFLLPWDTSIPEEVRSQLLEYASRNEAERFFELTLIKKIQSSPMKIEIMERWERDAFRSFEGAQEKLRKCKEV